MKKLLLVGGNNLLFQMFFGMPARIVNEQGKAIQGTLGFVGIKNAETVNCEADDWIAGYALKYRNDMQVIISSFDSAFFQLISNRLSAIGADNIKGVEKIGVKAAVLLLNEFGNLANILEYADKIAKPSVKQSILK